ncbi:MAG: hypothetical protein N4J56_002850 [Chroococcidiopsis sp. SAG 2025]|uniref:hypothetical protein n=1 Tax=Chroococcidiopsis sp. SAG 2025 TaxID=171389 RepID=UPI0029373A6F|nr:hypothetical protein [Chroococcidiopsis sp. SAG 2025]MDV2993196.1 hypothetical protein [Chroococcidiopsis sp. SAG 2025]
MDTKEKDLLESVVGELRVQRHRRDLNKFEKYPRLQRQLELALLHPSEEMRRKRLELLATDLREDMAAQIKSSFLDDFQDYQEFLSQGQKAPLYPPQNEVPVQFKQAMAKYKDELEEQVMREIEASYKPLMEQAKAKDALLPKRPGGRLQNKHQSELEEQMIIEEHKRLESPAFRNQLLAEERRLLQEHRRAARIQVNPLTQVQK